MGFAFCWDHLGLGWAHLVLGCPWSGLGPTCVVGWAHLDMGLAYLISCFELGSSCSHLGLGWAYLALSWANLVPILVSSYPKP